MAHNLKKNGYEFFVARSAENVQKNLPYQRLPRGIIKKSSWFALSIISVVGSVICPAKRLTLSPLLAAVSLLSTVTFSGKTYTGIDTLSFQDHSNDI
jgi:hypothetical protein